MLIKHLLFCTPLVAASAFLSLRKQPNLTQFDPCSYASTDILIRDVVVIGGGASGTYGAIALKDAGRSVAVVEREPHFGGHANTYTDPATGLALEYGVMGYANDSTTRAFFKRFNVSLGPLTFGSNAKFVDFSTGELVPGASRGANFTPYIQQVNKYYPDPAAGVRLPSPVPSELLMPFRDFITKYSLQDDAYTIWSFTSPDDNLLDQLTLYAFMGANSASGALLGGREGQDVTAQNNSELFGRAQKELGSSALVNSKVVATQRSKSGVSLVVQSGSTRKLVIASQVLFSAPIVLNNLLPFDLDQKEHAHFSEVYYTGWYTTLVKDTGLEPGTTYTNAAVDELYNIPLQPYGFRIGPSKINSTFYAFYGSQTELSEKEVKAGISKAIMTLSGSDKPPTFLAYASHTPFKQQISKEAVASGWYDQLIALQGYRSMHYTGNALDASGSSSLFNFTRNLIPAIEKGIKHEPVNPAAGKCSKHY